MAEIASVWLKSFQQVSPLVNRLPVNKKETP
jgi:hypothetical protein